MPRRDPTVLALLALLIGTSGPAFAGPFPERGPSAAPSKRRATSRTVPAETIIRVRLNEKLGSATNAIGDFFGATVAQAISAGGVELIPAGSTIEGRVASVARAKPGVNPGTLGLRFLSLRLPDGHSYPIDGSLTSVSGETAEFDASGKITGRASKRRDVIFAGVPTEGLTKGGSQPPPAATVTFRRPIVSTILVSRAFLMGPLIGTAIGRAIGDSANDGDENQAAEKRRTPTRRAGFAFDAEVAAGTQFGVLLNRALVFPE
jgi:hypothetical protein